MMVFRIALFLLAFLVSACDTGQPPTPEVTDEEVREEAAEAARTAGDFVSQQKREYINAMEGRYEALREDIDRLKARAVRSGEEAAEAVEARIGELEAQSEEVEARLNQLRASSGEAWQELRSGLDKAMDDLRASYTKMQEAFASN